MNEAGSPRITPVILCGGAGLRLWPLSRLDRPKPFVSLDGGATLLQETLARTRDPDRFGPPVVIVSAEFGGLVADQIEQAGLRAARLILEPSARGTAPAIALAAIESGPDDLLLVLPSDHLVSDVSAFHAAVERAAAPARDGWLVTFGVEPDRPETGYGYILRGDPIVPDVFRTERFVEKPDAETAALYVADGRFSWNSGIFLFSARHLLAALREHAPYILPSVEAAIAAAAREGDRLVPDAGSFARAPAQSIDHAVMERSDRVAVVPVAMGWSDVGSWESLYMVAAKDPKANALSGNIAMIDSEGSLVRSEGPLVVAVGLRDMVVVATERSVLVVPRGDSQRVKEAVEALISRGGEAPAGLSEGDE